MPNVKLASQRLNIGGSPGGLSPVLISGSAAGSVRAGRINPNAANVRYTPMPVPKIQTSTILDSAAKFSQTLFQETLMFQDRKDTVTAQNLVSDYDEALRKQWTGYQDEDGNFVKGYSSLEADEANAEYGNAVGAAEELMASKLTSASPAVRQKAAIRMQAARNTFLGRAAVHNARQLSVAEERARQREMQQAFKEVEVDSENGWKRIRNVAGQYKDPAKRVEAMQDGMTYATSKIYDEAIAGGASKDVAFAQAESFFNSHREELPEGVEANVSSVLRQQKEMIFREMEAKQKEALNTYRKRLEFQGSDAVFQMLHGGPETMKNLGAFSQHVMKAYQDSPVDGRDVIVKSFKSALRNIMQMNPEAGADVAWANLQRVMQKENMLIGDTYVIGELEGFVKTTLKNEAKAFQAEKKTELKQNIYRGLSRAKTLADVEHYKEEVLNADISAEEMSFLDGAVKAKGKEIEGKHTEVEKTQQNLNYLDMRDEAENGMTPEFEKRVYDMVESGGLKFTEANKLLDRAEKFATGAVSPDYGKLKTELKSIVTTEEMYYDPRTKQKRVGFWNMLDDDEKEQVKKAQEAFGKSDEVLEKLAVSALMNQAEIWRKNPANQGKTYMDWFTDFFSQQPEIKRGALSNFVRSSYNFMQSLGNPAPFTVDEGPIQEAVTYPWGQQQEKPTGEVIQSTGGATIMQRPVPQGEVREAAPAGQTIEDYAFSTIPTNRTAAYSKQPVDKLLAMQFLREGLTARDGAQYLDEYPLSQIDQWVQQALNDPGFEAWKQTKMKDLQ